MPIPLPNLNSFLATFVVAALFTLGSATTAQAQATSWSGECERIEGTVQVADDAPNKQALARVTHEQAAEAAVAALPGAAVQDTDLEEEDNYLVYEVDLVLDRQEHTAYIDAGSGAVLCMERDD